MSDIKALENHIEALRDLVAKRDMALKLSENHEFRKLFLDGFCRDEAARLIMMSTDPRISETIQKSCIEEARAAGFVKRYLSDIVTMGYKAQDDLIATNAELDELRVDVNS